MKGTLRRSRSRLWRRGFVAGFLAGVGLMYLWSFFAAWRMEDRGWTAYGVAWRGALLLAVVGLCAWGVRELVRSVRQPSPQPINILGGWMIAAGALAFLLWVAPPLRDLPLVSILLFISISLLSIALPRIVSRRLAANTTDWAQRRTED